MLCPAEEDKAVRTGTFPRLQGLWNILKFTASSLVGFLIDYGMFFLLSQLTAGTGSLGVPLSNVGARLVSASANYAINKKIVFKNKGGVAKTAASYFLLAAVILAGNTALVTFLTGVLSMNRYLAKILTECVFFTFSYLMQKLVIFRK